MLSFVINAGMQATCERCLSAEVVREHENESGRTSTSVERIMLRGNAVRSTKSTGTTSLDVVKGKGSNVL